MRRKRQFRFFGMLLSLLLWTLSVAVTTVHHHDPIENQQTHDNIANHDCDHHHDNSNPSHQDCGLCFVIHNQSSIHLDYWITYAVALYPTTMADVNPSFAIVSLPELNHTAHQLRGPPLFSRS
ncbi:hypothetical protein ACFSQ3_06765 [Sphingobacterium corticis]|uniref:DUF2946 domain-containing protein n=1 Tax=Sphingobacterium corticis TaxID=1812823 RepID=A0ABW5NJT0_9SPHI